VLTRCILWLELVQNLLERTTYVQIGASSFQRRRMSQRRRPDWSRLRMSCDAFEHAMSFCQVNRNRVNQESTLEGWILLTEAAFVRFNVVSDDPARLVSVLIEMRRMEPSSSLPIHVNNVTRHVCLRYQHLDQFWILLPEILRLI
jgi:hypothetical protein